MKADSCRLGDRLCKGPVVTADILVLSESQNRVTVAAWGVSTSLAAAWGGWAQTDRWVGGRAGGTRALPGCREEHPWGPYASWGGPRPHCA